MTAGKPGKKPVYRARRNENGSRAAGQDGAAPGPARPRAGPGRGNRRGRAIQAKPARRKQPRVSPSPAATPAARHRPTPAPPWRARWPRNRPAA